MYILCIVLDSHAHRLRKLHFLFEKRCVLCCTWFTRISCKKPIKFLSPVLQSAMYNFHLQIKPPIKGTYAACTRWTTTSRIGFWYIPIAVQERSSRKLQLTHTSELKCNLNPANRWYVASFPFRPSFSSLAVW